MPGRSVRIGRLAGIPIGINPLWLVIVALITWSLGSTYYPDEVSGIAPVAAYGLGLASALLLFASIVLHELGHAVVARRHGISIEGIDLWLLGGVAKLGGEPHEPGDELRYAAAGPAVTLLITAVFAIVLIALPAATPDAVQALLSYQLLINATILVFNLLPAFPLDGGRLLRAAVWARVRDLTRATAIAASVGRGFAYLFIGLGLLAAVAGGIGGLWLAVIGVFLLFAGNAEESHQRVRMVLSGHRVGELMTYPAVVMQAAVTVEEAVDVFGRHHYRAFPVLDGERVLGLITIDSVEALPGSRRSSTVVRDLVDTDPDLFTTEDADVADLVERPAFGRIGRMVVRTDRGDVGILSITEVQRALRAMSLQRPGPGSTAAAAR